MCAADEAYRKRVLEWLGSPIEDAEELIDAAEVAEAATELIFNTDKELKDAIHNAYSLPASVAAILRGRDMTSVKLLIGTIIVGKAYDVHTTSTFTPDDNSIDHCEASLYAFLTGARSLDGYKRPTGAYTHLPERILRGLHAVMEAYTQYDDKDGTLSKHMGDVACKALTDNLGLYTERSYTELVSDVKRNIALVENGLLHKELLIDRACDAKETIELVSDALDTLHTKFPRLFSEE